MQNIVSYGCEPRGTTVRVCQQLSGRQGNWISFVQHFVFPRRQKRQKNERRAQLQKRHGLLGEMWAWCEQTMINTVPSPQTPIFLDVILGADNRPALYRSHTRSWMRNRAGWEGAAVVFSQCLWSSDTQTQKLFFPHLTCHTVQQGAAQAGQVGAASRTHRQSASISWSVRLHGYLCLFGWTGVWWSLTKFLVGYCIDAWHARVTEGTENRNDRLY